MLNMSGLETTYRIVEFQGVSSAPEPVSVGVPQGSTLGPLLFILHLNDLPSAVVECSILMYADDTVVFFAAPEVSTIQATLVKELQAIECWLHLNSLFIYKTKTEAMLFGTSHKLAKISQFSITIGGPTIKRVTEFKYLGVIFDEHLSWNEHAKAIVSKAGRRVGMLGRVRRFIPIHSANASYILMIRPILEYCAGVWACCGEVNSGTLEALQRRVGKIVSKISSSDTAMEALKWPSLRTRRDDLILKLVWKCIDGRCPQYFNNYFVLNKHICTRSTRQNNLLHLPAIRMETARRSSFYYHGSTIFNNHCLECK